MTDDGVDAETSLSFSLSLFMSISLLRLFSRAHYWVNKYILRASESRRSDHGQRGSLARVEKNLGRRPISKCSRSTKYA